MRREYVIYPLLFRASKPSDPATHQDLVVTLESFRARLEDISTAKGLRKIYDSLKWPINGPDTQKLLQTVQRNTQIFHFALTVKGIKIVSQTSGKASDILSASQRYVLLKIPCRMSRKVYSLILEAHLVHDLRLICSLPGFFFDICGRLRGGYLSFGHP